MAMVRPFVFQVVGYQNSGKTTLSEGLIRLLTKEGLKVAAIKHHGHGGKPAVPEGKDSTRHMDAGAIASLVEGDGSLIMHAEQESWELQQQVSLLAELGPDIILIEGHKRAGYPKFVLVRNQGAEELPNQLDQVMAVIHWEAAPQNLYEVPVFPIKSHSMLDELFQIILKKMR
ncbi:molybdopterin-guanine dinucleotide biosynthesis protein B [Bacillus sp. EB01]|uniref:molybdopterin-guanine dinucleotide biosynthesis protein B n=1 Tax=Bacillus sp. EB01 TaxID=1347086 RepID=UPI0005C795DF|nr:molybdopterin-guanine dinucleotide biosynthesis protein B [Bacillus sp. EB01]